MDTGRVDAATVRRFVVGDLLAVLAFVVAGEYRHNVDPLVAPWAIVGTLLPFWIGWAIAGPLAGAYSDRVRASVRAMAARTVGAWLLAAGVAMGLRATAAFRGDAASTFFLVAAVSGGALLLLWRGTATALR